MYAGKLKQNIPTGPGTFFRQNDKNIFIGEWMGAKSDGKTRWSYGEWLEEKIIYNKIAIKNPSIGLNICKQMSN